jgi:transcriptional/translational regulatory protein YebC/TACO1
MVENIFDLDKIKAVDEVTERLVRSHGVLVLSDSVAWFYKYKGDIYVLPPEVEEPSSFESALERAVIEAGFDTEELRHCLQELYECLYLRMLNDPIKGFTEKEWRACQVAKRLLGLDG